MRAILRCWCSTYWVPTLRTRGDRMAGYVDPVSSDAAIREAHGEPLEPAEAVGLFVHDMWGHPFSNIAAAMRGRPNPAVRTGQEGPADGMKSRARPTAAESGSSTSWPARDVVLVITVYPKPE